MAIYMHDLNYLCLGVVLYFTVVEMIALFKCKGIEFINNISFAAYSFGRYTCIWLMIIVLQLYIIIIYIFVLNVL